MKWHTFANEFPGEYLLQLEALEKIKRKIALKAKLVGILEDRIKLTTSAMDSAQNAANNEDKSTVGDKHEVSRSMAMFDREIHARQLDAAQKDLTLVLQTDVTQLHSNVIAGSYVEADNGKYFFLTGLGSIETEFGKVFFLSLNSPVGKTFVNKRAGETIQFNNKQIKLVDVY